MGACRSRAWLSPGENTRLEMKSGAERSLGRGHRWLREQPDAAVLGVICLASVGSTCWRESLASMEGA
jgi:hypothetical protein